VADAPVIPDEVEAGARWGDSAWTRANAVEIDTTLVTFGELLTA